MKKSVIVFGLVALFGLGLVSCKKDCTCVGKVNNHTVPGTEVTTSNTKKKDCKDYSETYMGQTATFDCTWGK